MYRSCYLKKSLATAGGWPVLCHKQEGIRGQLSSEAHQQCGKPGPTSHTLLPFNSQEGCWDTTAEKQHFSMTWLINQSTYS